MDFNINEIKPIIKFIIKNNERLQEEGKDPVAIDLVSEAGIGKSSIVQQIAEEIDANYVKLALAQITETGDIAGFPVCLHYCCNDNGDCKWIVPELIDSFVKAGYHMTSETKMSYALPDWYNSLNLSKPTILLLDDATRALPNILQACYELIYKQEFWSFKLPPRTTIILTTNPDNGDYNVNSLDEAGNTRKVTFKLKFDPNSWAEYAEHVNIDGRSINFLLSYSSELFKENSAHEHIMNARSYTMFSNIISGISDWSAPSSLAMIMQIANGCFNDKDNIIGSLFTTFIANKLDKLISPEDMLFGEWDKTKDRIEDCVYDGDKYKTPVASILQTRLLNRSIEYLSQKGSNSDVVVNRLLKILDADKMLFSEDFMFNIIKTLYSKFSSRLNKFLLNGRLRNVILND